MAPDATSCCSRSGEEPSCHLGSSFLDCVFSCLSPSAHEIFPSTSAALFACEDSPSFDISPLPSSPPSTSTSSSSFEQPAAARHRSYSSADPISSITSRNSEENLPVAMLDLPEMDIMIQEPDLGVKRSVEDSWPCQGSYQPESGCNKDMFLSRVDKPLQSDSSHDVLDTSGFISMSDLFPDWSVPRDSALVDEVGAWPTVDNQLGCLNPSDFLKAEDAQSVPRGIFNEQEGVSQMFADWLHSNSHWVSMSDLRKIKLKTSTIENVTKRLGGGREGQMQFLKLVLMWLQNSRENAVAGNDVTGLPLRELQIDLPPSDLSKTTAVSDVEGISTMDTLVATARSNIFIDAKPQKYPPLPGCFSTPASEPYTKWTSPRGEVAHTMLGYTNFSGSDLRCYTPSTDGSPCGQDQGTSLYHTSSPWPHDGNYAMHGFYPPFLPTLPSQIPVSKTRIGAAPHVIGDNTGTATQQQRGVGSNSAAAFRAARKNRMERQRWSVRHNRKWAASGQQRHPSMVEMSGNYEPAKTASWSQSPSNGTQNSCVDSQTWRLTSRGKIPADEQSKLKERDLKLLFHKQLKQTDVGNLGRIVLPKAAETCLPPLKLRDGVNLLVEDMNTSKVWKMRYRFWPNNKSRMYLLENTSDFVNINELKEGDSILMFSLLNRYVIQGIKGAGIQSSVLSRSHDELHAGDKRRRNSLEEMEEVEEANLASLTSDGLSSEDSCRDLSIVELIENSLECVP